MTNLKIGSKVIFRNNEICTIKEVITNDHEYTTCNAQFQTVTIKPGEQETIVLQFDDGEITLVDRSEFRLI